MPQLSMNGRKNTTGTSYLRLSPLAFTIWCFGELQSPSLHTQVTVGGHFYIKSTLDLWLSSKLFSMFPGAFRFACPVFVYSVGLISKVHIGSYSFGFFPWRFQRKERISHLWSSTPLQVKNLAAMGVIIRASNNLTDLP